MNADRKSTPWGGGGLVAFRARFNASQIYNYSLFELTCGYIDHICEKTSGVSKTFIAQGYQILEKPDTRELLDQPVFLDLYRNHRRLVDDCMHDIRKYIRPVTGVPSKLIIRQSSKNKKPKTEGVTYIPPPTLTTPMVEKLMTRLIKPVLL